MNTAHITELQAVNRMLVSIGETPVNNLDGGLTEAAMALEILRGVSREVQTQGWLVNTWRNYKLTADVNGNFILGADVLKVDTVRESQHINVVMKPHPDGTKYILWDYDNHTEVFTQTYLYVDLVMLMDFNVLTPALQHYITCKAGATFQKGAVSSPVLHEFSQEDIYEALLMAEAYESETEGTNCLISSPTLYGITRRNNYLWGN